MQIDTLLVKVASRCNINCTYCYVYNMGDDGWRDMPAIMSQRTVLALASAIGQLAMEQERPFATVLHGGEPLMLGARRLDFFLRSLREQLPLSHALCMQTNGMLMTREIADICAKYRVAISVSLDGPEEINDRFRLGKRGESTHDRVVSGIQTLRNHPDAAFLFSGLLAVVDPSTDPAVIYDYLKGMGAPSIDFLYRDGNHSRMPYGKQSFESTEYGFWFCQLLEKYLSDRNPPRVRFLDDMVRLSLGSKGIKEGLGSTDYGIAIIDTDGTITKNDTLKSSYDGADRFNQKWSVHTHTLSNIFATDEFKGYHELQRATSPHCTQCPYLQVCGGGMPLHRWKEGAGFDNPSVYCNDQKTIIHRVISRLRNEGLPLDPRLTASTSSASTLSV